MTWWDIVSGGDRAWRARRSGLRLAIALFVIGSAIVASGNLYNANASSHVASGAPTGAKKVALPPDLAHIVFSGGDGSSCQKAVVIEHAKNTAEGLAAEKAWLAARYPQARIAIKAQSGEKNRYYETVELQPKAGEKVRVCFDITGFFGRM
jgi:hypothetical protein